MTETTPTLYILNRNYSSWSLRGWIALRALNIKFDTVELIISSDNETKDLFTPEANALMARAGPTGKVHTKLFCVCMIPAPHDTTLTIYYSGVGPRPPRDQAQR